MNIHKNTARPFSSHKNINVNYLTNINQNSIPTSINNNSNKIDNKKGVKSAFIDLIYENKDNKSKKNSLFMKAPNIWYMYNRLQVK